ncbi:MAG: tetratricopeptide repeat protein, partial [Planctomycetales bacterium]|nr:tetratricopeptide repeat protein [Planctomycetales bacterium]
ASIHKNLGLCLALTGRKEEAIVHLTRSLQLNPHDASVANNLGGLYAGAGDWDQAIRYLERAAGLAPTNEKFRRNLAAAREAQGRDRPTTSDPPIDGETEN